MTGTAATQADEFLKIYDLDVEVIPDQPARDPRGLSGRGLPHEAEKEQAILDEIRAVHANRAAGADRHRERGRIGAAQRAASGHSASGSECPA